jgi:hypothetical protein
MGHVECPQSEPANNDLQPSRSWMVAATNCERVGDQSRNGTPVSAAGKTGHFESPAPRGKRIQALSVDLRKAVMACLSGRESRRWTIAELVERFKNLGVCAPRASVTAALVELGLELELSSWAPWRLLAAVNQSPSSNRRRTECILHKISNAQEHDCDDKDSRSTKKTSRFCRIW